MTDETTELVACDCCGGTGRVDGPTRDAYGVREDYPAEVECPHCGGTGVQAA
jgi:DnaJ-class molecular chaperone